MKQFVEHMGSHDWSPVPNSWTSPAQLRIEAILLGIASSALWDFVKWCLEHLNADLIQRTLGNLFYLNVPMGGGALSAERYLSQNFENESRRAQNEESMEEGLFQKIDDLDAGILDLSLKGWMLSCELRHDDSA